MRTTKNNDEIPSFLLHLHFNTIKTISTSQRRHCMMVMITPYQTQNQCKTNKRERLLVDQIKPFFDVMPFLFQKIPLSCSSRQPICLFSSHKSPFYILSFHKSYSCASSVQYIILIITLYHHYDLLMTFLQKNIFDNYFLLNHTSFTKLK